MRPMIIAIFHQFPYKANFSHKPNIFLKTTTIFQQFPLCFANFFIFFIFVGKDIKKTINFSILKPPHQRLENKKA